MPRASSEARARRLADATRALAALLLFIAGLAVAVALRRGLYANAVLGGLVSLRLAALLLRRGEAKIAATPALVTQDLAAVEAELRRLRFMLDQAPVPLLTVSPSGVVEAANRAARSLFRVDGRVMDPPIQLLDAVTAATPGQRNVLKLASPVGSDPGRAPQPLDANPTLRSYALSVASWSSADGPALLAVLIDIQAELQAAEAAALRDVLQTLGHEVMNALTPVTSLAETALALLTADASAPQAALPDIADALETIARRARGLDRFVQGYRALAKVPPAIRRPGSVGALLDEAALLFRSRWRNAGVTLSMRRPVPDILADLDAELLGQALTALLTNAAEAALAMPGRASIVELAAEYAPPNVHIRVADNGRGIDPSQRGLIFQPLFTTKPNGTGIGLGIARQIALSHGGTLILEDATTAGGAVFRLVF